MMNVFLRFLLEEDVYEHWHLQRGIPQAISTMIHYAVLLLGFFIALALVGVDLAKVRFWQEHSLLASDLDYRL